MTGESARRLILLRHGKSDYPGGVRDHDRPLAPRGRREAALAGHLLTEIQPSIDAVLCSTALRTRETLAATGIDAPVTYSDDIYDASPGEIVDLVAATDDQVRTLLMVGHAPGMPGTALVLAGGSAGPTDLDAGAGTVGHNPDADRRADLLTELRAHFPTSAFAVLQIRGAWADLAANGGVLVDFVSPGAVRRG